MGALSTNCNALQVNRLGWIPPGRISLGIVLATCDMGHGAAGALARFADFLVGEFVVVATKLLGDSLKNWLRLRCFSQLRLLLYSSSSDFCTEILATIRRQQSSETASKDSAAGPISWETRKLMFDYSIVSSSSAPTHSPTVVCPLKRAKVSAAGRQNLDTRYLVVLLS